MNRITKAPTAIPSSRPSHVRSLAPGHKESWPWFLLIGLLLAGLEEFITQGVLKDNFGGWVLPTVIAFAPFLIISLLLGRVLRARLGEARTALVCYLAAGTAGLLFEWFAMGLAPWRNPNLLQIPFQVGMFSFWGTVALAPRVLLDRRERFSQIRKPCVRSLILGFVLAYSLAFTLSREKRFGAVLATFLLIFTALNGFYIRYFWILRQSERS